MTTEWIESNQPASDKFSSARTAVVATERRDVVEVIFRNVISSLTSSIVMKKKVPTYRRPSFSVNKERPRYGCHISLTRKLWQAGVVLQEVI